MEARAGEFMERNRVVAAMAETRGTEVNRLGREIAEVRAMLEEVRAKQREAEQRARVAESANASLRAEINQVRTDWGRSVAQSEPGIYSEQVHRIRQLGEEVATLKEQHAAIAKRRAELEDKLTIETKARQSAETARNAAELVKGEALTIGTRQSRKSSNSKKCCGSNSSPWPNRYNPAAPARPAPP